MLKCDKCGRRGLVLSHPRKKKTDPIAPLADEELKKALRGELSLEWVCVKCGHSEKN